MLLDIIQDVCDEFGFSSPTVAVTSTDLTVKQLVAFAKKEGKELGRRFDWQALKREVTFTTVATSVQTALTAVCTESAADTAYEFDFLRLVDQSMWNRTNNWRVQGPLDSIEWQLKQAAAADAGIGNMFRIFQNSIYFFPTPAAGDSIYFEYISRNWCESAGAAGQSTWLADDDVARLSEDVIRLGVVWRFRKSKGLDYGEDFASYERAVSEYWGYDGGRDIITFGSGELGEINLPTIAEGNWPES